MTRRGFVRFAAAFAAAALAGCGRKGPPRKPVEEPSGGESERDG